MHDAIAVAIIAGIAGIVTAIIQITGKHRQAENHQLLKIIREQVTNSHGTNLRDDLDRMRDNITDRIGEIRSDIRGLRKDIGRTEDRESDLDMRIRTLERKQANG